MGEFDTIFGKDDLDSIICLRSACDPWLLLDRSDLAYS